MTFTVRRLTVDRKKRSFPWKRLIVVAGFLEKPAMWLWNRWQQKREERRQRQERINILKRIFVILITILCALLLFAGTVKALVSLKLLSINSIVSVAGADLPVDGHGHTNILLLGQGDETHDGVDLTDTIMIASLDPADTKSVVLLSLPRDLYFLETENMGTGRINSLYRDYKNYMMYSEDKGEAEASVIALEALKSEIGKALGMELHHIVKVDFVGFVQAVDAIGGIDIVVPEDLVDNAYPGPNYTYEIFAIAAGPQHLDGETALKYARSRHSTSDFSRSARQQQILRAIADKVRNEGVLTSPNQILSLMQIMNEHVETTLQVREMAGLAELGREIDQSRIITMQINDQNGLYGSFTSPGGFLYGPPREQFGGASVLLPVSIPENPVTWKQLKTLTQLLIHDRTGYVDPVSVDVLNAGAAAGSSRRLGGELNRYGFNVDKIENAEIEDQPTSFIEAPDTKEARFFAELLNLELKVLPPPSSSASDSPDRRAIRILLGEDYEYAPIQNLVNLPGGQSSSNSSSQ